MGKTPDYTATADYFEDRARRVRDEVERKRLLKVAAKYREMAKDRPGSSSGIDQPPA